MQTCIKVNLHTNSYPPALAGTQIRMIYIRWLSDMKRRWRNSMSLFTWLTMSERLFLYLSISL